VRFGSKCEELALSICRPLCTQSPTSKRTSGQGSRVTSRDFVHQDHRGSRRAHLGIRTDGPSMVDGASPLHPSAINASPLVRKQDAWLPLGNDVLDPLSTRRYIV